MKLSLLVALVALAFAAPALACTSTTSLAALDGEVMCPVCKTTLDMSDSPIATRIEQFIARQAAPPVCASKSQIKHELVAQFGPSILAEPPKRGFDLLAWLLPIVGILGGAALLGYAAWRWSRTRDPAPALAAVPAGLDPALERRLDDELRRFDA